MNQTNITIEQAEFIQYVQTKVSALFDEYPVEAHGYEHVARVARWAQEIAEHESQKDVFLATLGGWLHDIGRAVEKYDNPEGKRHHELSYDLLKQWMQEDIKFYFLKDNEKMELLYAVRYHWNNFADKYTSAVIVRDADKMDLFGDIGMARIIEFNGHDEEQLEFDLRLKFEDYYFLRSPYARKIVEDNDMFRQINDYFEKYLRSKIEPITLK